jgi:hypothetical protein
LFYLCPWRGFSPDGGRDTGKRSQTFYFLYVAPYLPYIALYFRHIALYSRYIALDILNIVQYLLHSYVGSVGT